MRLSVLSSFALLAGIAVAATSTPAAARTKPCPLVLMKYCVVTKAGVRETVATNTCLARRSGERILHRGACEGPICSFIFKPVCSLDPFTHTQRTYGNLCLSDVGNATFLHNGACK
jgi:hypothetical protein